MLVTGNFMKSIAAKIAQHVYLLVLLFVSAAALTACGDNFRGMDKISSCTESSDKQITSPHGDYVATVYQRNCGATTGFVTHINLRLANTADRIEPNGTIIQDQILLANGTPLIKVLWLDDANLELRVDPKDRPNIASIQESWKSVRIKLDN